MDSNKVASLGDVIITDSANHTAYGTMIVVTKTEREEYTVTVNENNLEIKLSTTITKGSELDESIKDETGMDVSILFDTDDVVGLSSQIGWKDK